MLHTHLHAVTASLLLAWIACWQSWGCTPQDHGLIQDQPTNRYPGSMWWTYSWIALLCRASVLGTFLSGPLMLLHSAFIFRYLFYHIIPCDILCFPVYVFIMQQLVFVLWFWKVYMYSLCGYVPVTARGPYSPGRGGALQVVSEPRFRLQTWYCWEVPSIFPAA